MANSVKPASNFSTEDLAKVEFKEISLSVIVADDVLSFLALRNSQPIAFELFNTENKKLAEIISSSQFHKKDFKEVTLIFDNKYFSVLPPDLASEKEKELISKTFFGNNNLITFISKNVNLDFIYAVENHTIELLNQIWPEAKSLHYSEIFYSNMEAKNKADEEVFLDIRKDYFLAAIFKNNKLLLLNKYDFSGRNDFGFFSLGIINHHALDSKKLKLFLSGNIVENSPLQLLLEKYIANIQLLKFDNIAFEFVSMQHIINFLQR